MSHPIPAFMNQILSLTNNRGITKQIVINAAYLREQARYATLDPVISRIRTFYQELLFKMPVNIIASIARKGTEEEIVLDLASKEFNKIWVPVLKPCLSDLLTHGFYILRFKDTQSETLMSHYSSYNVGISIRDYTGISSEHMNALKKLPDQDDDSFYRPEDISIYSMKPVRIDPCSVTVTWSPDWVSGMHSFIVKNEEQENLDALVFYDPACFQPGLLPTSVIRRVIPYADSLEKIRVSQVELYTQMPHPLLIVTNDFDNKDFVPPVPTNVASSHTDDIELLNRTAATMVSNFSTSNELVTFSINNSHVQPSQKLSNMKSNIIPDNITQTNMLDENNVLGLPPGHDIKQITQYPPLNIQATTEELMSLIAMQFGVYPTFFTGDIKNTTNEGLRILYQQIAGFVNSLQSLFKSHMTIMLQHCFPDIRLRLSKTKFEYFNSSIEVVFSSSESATAQDILDFWHLGIISNEAFIDKIKGMFDISEIDKNFKTNIVSNNDMRILEREKLKAEIKNTLRSAAENSSEITEKDDEEKEEKEGKTAIEKRSNKRQEDEKRRKEKRSLMSKEDESDSEDENKAKRRKKGNR